MPTNNKTESLYAVLARVQKKLERAEKSSRNPHYKSLYAGLDEFIEVARPVLNEEGCFLSHSLDFIAERTELREDGTKVHYPRQDFCTCRIIYGDQEVKSSMPLLISGRGDDNQAFGSALTYARRYTLQALLCIATDEPDDDGNAAVGEEAIKAKLGRRGNGAPKQEAAKASEFIKS